MIKVRDLHSFGNSIIEIMVGKYEQKHSNTDMKESKYASKENQKAARLKL